MSLDLISSQSRASGAPPGPDEHLDACWRHLHEELRLGALLALTRGRVAAGAAAWRAVMPLLDDRIGYAHLQLLGGTRCGPQVVVAALEDAVARLSALPEWQCDRIERALGESLASQPTAAQLLSLACLRAPSPLPLADVMTVMGRHRTVSRLSDALQAYRSAQLVG